MEKFAPPQLYTTDEVLPALRDLLSHHPAAASSSPEKLARRLYVLRYLPFRPEVCEVAAALEALCIEGEILA